MHRARDRLRTYSVDEVIVDVECDQWYRQQSEEQLENAGDCVDVTALVGKRLRAIAVCQQMI